MGMTIDKIIKKLLWFEDYNEDTYCGGDRIQDEYGDWYYKVNEDDFEAFRQAAEIMRKYQKLQADYENRLKADLKAILVELQLDVEGQKFDVHIDKDVWNDAIRVCSEIIQQKINELPSVTPQEPFKPMVEIDLYSVIKQKYIEREVLDKIRAEIETKYGRCTLVEYFVQYDGICTGRKDIGDIADVLQIIDKHKAEIEPQENEEQTDD